MILQIRHDSANSEYKTYSCSDREPEHQAEHFSRWEIQTLAPVTNQGIMHVSL